MGRRRHFADLGRFYVGNEGNFGGGSFIEHRFGRCDWQLDIDWLSLPEVARKARGHAAFCDGSRQPPPPRREPSALGAQVQKIWGPSVVAALQKELRYGRK
jgi:hypothetical protein